MRIHLSHNQLCWLHTFCFHLDFSLCMIFEQWLCFIAFTFLDYGQLNPVMLCDGLSGFTLCINMSSAIGMLFIGALSMSCSTMIFQKSYVVIAEPFCVETNGFSDLITIHSVSRHCLSSCSHTEFRVFLLTIPGLWAIICAVTMDWYVSVDSVPFTMMINPFRSLI